jgi:hypothetical protein
MNDLGVRRVTRVHGMDTETGPDRGQGPEVLVGVDPVAAVHALGARCREQEGEVIARLTMTGREHLTSHRFLEDPAEAFVAAMPQIRGHSSPVHVHVEGEGGGGRTASQATLFLAHLGQAHAQAAQLGRDGHQQIARGPDLLEVFRKEAILPVIAGGPRRTVLKDLLGQHSHMDASGSMTRLTVRKRPVTNLRTGTDCGYGMASARTEPAPRGLDQPADPVNPQPGPPRATPGPARRP